jgi:hypothetical protein
MKIGVGERYANWWVSNRIHLLPSLFFQWGDGYIDNLDTGRVQRHFEFEVHFDFLFLSSFISIHLMWGDNGEVIQENL